MRSAKLPIVQALAQGPAEKSGFANETYIHTLYFGPSNVKKVGWTLT